MNPSYALALDLEDYATVDIALAGGAIFEQYDDAEPALAANDNSYDGDDNIYPSLY